METTRQMSERIIKTFIQHLDAHDIRLAVYVQSAQGEFLAEVGEEARHRLIREFVNKPHAVYFLE